ncbi:hypothetical protein LRS74_21015 [Streptomyces sp. LX-29]|uniref:hypothetical protein n=1 Tax=Streptomyces sp. LX-29 TaxID=2900152 RepID=UPI00240DA5E0|nr:hypothetical protein [Streptomyces sp. LX-29]WFB09240.1 hypothetical protein LRS74_21015 [Streptomyces sp. LX-29]
MKPTRRLISSLVLVAALGGAAACGPEDDTAGGSTGGSASQPAKDQKDQKAGEGEGKGTEEEGPGDCGEPPTLPAGHKMVEIAVPPSKGSLSAKDAAPECTPNDFIYHGKGKANYYLFAPETNAQLSTGSGTHKEVPVGELWSHAADCLTDQSAVKAPYSCSGNIYDITLDGEGKIDSIKEVWHP